MTVQSAVTLDRCEAHVEVTYRGSTVTLRVNGYDSEVCIDITVSDCAAIRDAFIGPMNAAIRDIEDLRDTAAAREALRDIKRQIEESGR